MLAKPLAAPLFSISAVERDTGLSKDTLRVWERRYGFPLPGRDANGERVYTAEQVEKLRAIKKLIDRGQRPGKLIGLSLEELRERSLAADAIAVDAGAAGESGLAEAVELVKAHHVDALRQMLRQAMVQQGLASFMLETAAPLNGMVGDAWMRGDLEVFEEHLYTEVMQGVLRSAIAGIPAQGRTPRIVLTTLPNEQHALGLLMAEGMFAMEGATCISLGTQTPVWDIVLAAAAQRADVVALSVSVAFPANVATDALADLRAKLPAAAELWVGGSNPGPQRRPVGGALVLRKLEDIPGAVARWRQAHAPSTAAAGDAAPSLRRFRARI
ncbi:MAG: MerR family transcriptional regulator [Burkholderiales bacterium]|nr:MerR family transcriptional regulator [Burkholderiales bacterium]